MHPCVSAHHAPHVALDRTRGKEFKELTFVRFVSDKGHSLSISMSLLATKYKNKMKDCAAKLACADIS